MKYVLKHNYTGFAVLMYMLYSTSIHTKKCKTSYQNHRQNQETSHFSYFAYWLACNWWTSPHVCTFHPVETECSATLTRTRSWAAWVEANHGNVQRDFKAILGGGTDSSSAPGTKIQPFLNLEKTTCPTKTHTGKHIPIFVEPLLDLIFNIYLQYPKTSHFCPNSLKRGTALHFWPPIKTLGQVCRAPQQCRHALQGQERNLKI